MPAEVTTTAHGDDTARASRRLARVVVVGGGVVGLTTAITIVERGVCAAGDVVVIDPLALEPGKYVEGRAAASSVAPAMFTPYPPPEADRTGFARWTRTSLARLTQIATDPTSGVTMGELREYCYGPDRLEGAGEWMADLLRVRPLACRPPLREVTTSMRPHIDMVRYVPWLARRASGLGIGIVPRRIDSLAEAATVGGLEGIGASARTTHPYGAVVLCAGLGSGALCGDTSLRPMLGRVLHVPNDIGLAYSLHDDAAGPSGKVAYIFRFSDRLVLGGTFDRRTGPADTAHDAEAEDRGIIDRCRELLRLDAKINGGVGDRWKDLARSVIERRWALRPTRGVTVDDSVYENIRLECQRGPACEAGLREPLIVHHYGHGRMGATISWGTAADVADALLAG